MRGRRGRGGRGRAGKTRGRLAAARGLDSTPAFSTPTSPENPLIHSSASSVTNDYSQRNDAGHSVRARVEFPMLIVSGLAQNYFHSLDGSFELPPKDDPEPGDEFEVLQNDDAKDSSRHTSPPPRRRGRQRKIESSLTRASPRNSQ